MSTPTPPDPPQPLLAGPGGPGGEPYQGPPRRSRRRLLLVVGAALAAVLVVVAVLAALGVGRSDGDPSATADRFMAALKAKDVGAAHGLLCQDGRAKVSESALRADFDLDDRTITAYVLGPERTRDRDGKKETLVPVAINYDHGPPVRVDLGVWNEGGPKVCSLNDSGAG